jgi:hypothetical protein
MKSNEEKFMTMLRTETNCKMLSVLSRTMVMRIIKYFPNKGNQRETKIICYNDYGVIERVYSETTYLSPILIRRLLPKRITLIEDEFYMNKKDFNWYK